jgi:transposase
MKVTNFVGIDNSHSSHSVVIIDREGRKVQHFIIDNTLKGFEILEARLSNYDIVAIGCEIAHGPLIDFLKVNKSEFYSLNPLKVKRFKETHTISKNKNDYVDALAIAQYLKANYGCLRPMVFSSPEVEELKHLCTIHDQLKVEHKRLTVQLLDALKRYFPLLSVLFSRSTLPILSHIVLNYPTWEDLKITSEEDLRHFMFKHHYPGKDIARLLERIRNHKQFISPDVVMAYSCKARILASNILMVKMGLKEIEQRMMEITKHHRLGEVFLSVPGSGPILGPKLLAIFGDNKSIFQNYNSAQCYFGTAPRNYQSGKVHRVIMRRACNKQARNVLFQLAFISILHSTWAREYYDAQRSKGKKHSVAVRALSNKWVKILYYLWLREEPYSEEKRVIQNFCNVA